jgi:hypothetical protein
LNDDPIDSRSASFDQSFDIFAVHDVLNPKDKRMPTAKFNDPHHFKSFSKDRDIQPNDNPEYKSKDEDMSFLEASLLKANKLAPWKDDESVVNDSINYENAELSTRLPAKTTYYAFRDQVHQDPFPIKRQGSVDERKDGSIVV